MIKPPEQSAILVICTDTMLAYLFQRYAEQSGCQMVQRVSAPWEVELRRLNPATIIFS